MRLAQIESKLNELSRNQRSTVESFPFQDLSQPYMIPNLLTGYSCEPQMLQNFSLDYNAGSQVDPMIPGFDSRQNM